MLLLPSPKDRVSGSLSAEEKRRSSLLSLSIDVLDDVFLACLVARGDYA